VAVLHVRLGDGVAAMEVLARPDAVDDRELSTDTLTTTALGLWQSGELGRALDLVSAAPISRNGTAWEADLVAVRGMIRLYAGRLRPALADLDQAVRFAHLWRPSTNQSRIYGLRSLTRFLVGDWDGASIDAAAGRALAQGSAEAWSAALALAVSVQVPAHRGQWDVANRYLMRAKDASAGFAAFPIFERLLGHEVAAAVARDDHRAVLDVLTPVWSDEYLRRLSLVRCSRELMQARIAALARLGRPAEAEADLARYEAMLHDFPEGPVPRRLGWLRGLVAEARALPHRAREHYAADLADDDLQEVPFLRAQLLQTSGRLERALGNRREAIRRLSGHARNFFGGAYAACRWSPSS
jgi:tetratricopeptide (TPR) repeat protein